MPANESFFRDLKRLHVVFAVSALALLAATLWMMEVDHDREWRDVQSTFTKIEAERLRRELDSAEKDPAYEKSVAELQAEQTKAQAALDAKKDELKQLEEKVSAAKQDMGIAERTMRDQRAYRDVARANYGLAVRDAKPEAVLGELLAKYEDEERKVAVVELEYETKRLASNAAVAELQEQTGARDRLAAELKRTEADVDRLGKSLYKLTGGGDGFWAWKREIMTWPIIDGFNSPQKIQMDWLPDLKIKLGMASSARFDRCRTCHQAIDRVAPGNQPAFPFAETKHHDLAHWIDENKFPHPYASHPNLDLYLTAASPHPVQTFGCTICHDGQGSGTSFTDASHGPDTPFQEHVWAHERHYHSNHYWEYPMLPRRFEESSCLKCHHQVEELGHSPKFGASAPKLFQGYKTIERFGCFGCHEFNGFNASLAIGPDLRLEPPFASVAEQLLADSAFAKQSEPAAVASLAEMRRLVGEVVSEPEESAVARKELRELLAADAKSATPALRTDSHRLADALKDVDQPGKLRKVGPSLRHVAGKTTSAWLEFWTEDPKRFRPTTRMPQFFHLSNQQDKSAHELQPIEIAGVVSYLLDKSQPLDLLKPQEGYEPDAKRGAEAFARRGCLACHSHEKFPAAKADFGPELSKVHAKIKPGPEGFQWLYTWIRDPQRYHPRSKMPNLFLEPEKQAGADVDPAADIAAFLLTGGPGEYKPIDVEESALDSLVAVLLPLSDPEKKKTFAGRKYPLLEAQVKGDEIELIAGAPKDSGFSPEEWHRRKLNYVGRRTVSRYGCFGCHDIPGFETGRPIGTPLQDWGRKDTSRLAFEHIAEYLEHHGEPDGSSTKERAERELLRAEGGEFKNRDEESAALAPAYYVESLQHHGRPGFLWQKLREPRSYDYKTTETKRWDERLRMPKFPFSETEIEAVATFVLGLVAEPPGSRYVYAPQGDARARVQGEKLLAKFNCTGCHIVDLPKITYGAKPESLPLFKELDPASYPDGFELLMQLKPPKNADTGRKLPTGETVISFHGLQVLPPDKEEAPEDQFYYFDTWENLRVGDGLVTMENPRLEVPVTKLESIEPARGGDFAEWLVGHLVGGRPDPKKVYEAWQASPPPLFEEGIKVQTPWLYQFLREPNRLRYTTVLRMPKFNMSRDEAQTLANYFAAVDGAPYPYQRIPQREPEYEALMNRLLTDKGESADYLHQGWQVLTAPAPAGLCIKCHAVGGMPFQGTGKPDEIRGPNLLQAQDRLRPDWTLLWLYKPSYVTPYTAMPAPLPRTKKQFENLYGGDGNLQTLGLRDALMNYQRLIERSARTTPPAAAATPPAAGGE